MLGYGECKDLEFEINDKMPFAIDINKLSSIIMSTVSETQETNKFALVLLI